MTRPIPEYEDNPATRGFIPLDVVVGEAIVPAIPTMATPRPPDRPRPTLTKEEIQQINEACDRCGIPRPDPEEPLADPNSPGCDPRPR